MDEIISKIGQVTCEKLTEYGGFRIGEYLGCGSDTWQAGITAIIIVFFLIGGGGFFFWGSSE